jgi:CheY-like chemotaxis protein
LNGTSETHYVLESKPMRTKPSYVLFAVIEATLRQGCPRQSVGKCITSDRLPVTLVISLDEVEDAGMDDLRQSTILIAEDSGEDVLMLKRAFHNARIANPLIEVRDGEQAMHYLSGVGVYADRARYPIPFLMLLDLRMPKMSGFEVLERVREQPALHELIVVVLTGSDNIRDVNRAHELGANSYLIKPGNFDELVEMVKRIEGHWLMLGKAPEQPNSRNSQLAV